MWMVHVYCELLQNQTWGRLQACATYSFLTEDFEVGLVNFRGVGQSHCLGRQDKGFQMLRRHPQKAWVAKITSKGVLGTEMKVQSRYYIIIWLWGHSGLEIMTLFNVWICFLYVWHLCNIWHPCTQPEAEISFRRKSENLTINIAPRIDTQRQVLGPNPSEAMATEE